MAFISEWVQEKDWDLYNSFDFYFNHKRKLAHKNCYWTVDREREIYFIFSGGGNMDMPEEYSLIWKERKVRIERKAGLAYESPSGENKLHMKIIKIVAEKSLEGKKDELIELIKEIFEFRCEGSQNLVIEYIVDPTFVEGRIFE